MTQCPKCGFERTRGADECARCGVVFSRYESHRIEHTEQLFESTQKPSRNPGAFLSRHAPPVSLPPAEVLVEDDEVEDGRLGKGELGILGFGLVSALVVVSVPFLSMVIWPIKTLFHELGHAVTAWLLGHPSIPAFDFAFGGGLTHYGETIAAGLLWLGWQLRGNALSVAVLTAIALGWLFVITSAWRRETVIASAGVLFEPIMATIFLSMALANIGFRNAVVERPLAAFVAFVVQMFTTRFLWQLRSDDQVLASYREGKGGALMNDLEVMALNLHIHTPWNPGIQGLAVLLLLFSLVPMTLAMLWFFNRRRCARALTRLRLLKG